MENALRGANLRPIKPDPNCRSLWFPRLRDFYATSFYTSRQAIPTYTVTSECQRVSDYTPPLSGCGTATLAEAPGRHSNIATPMNDDCVARAQVMVPQLPFNGATPLPPGASGSENEVPQI